MKDWLREDILRRVLRNTGLLGAGKAGGALLHLATLILSARLLGPHAFGLLVLVRSYAQAASGLAKFQSWQTLIRFGATRAERRDVEGFLDLTALTVVIDAGSGSLALVAAALAANLAGPALGISADATALTQLYCLAIPFMSSATPTGVLRIFDRFDRLSVQSVVTPSVRLAGIGIAAWAGSSLLGFVLAWLASDLVGELYLWLHGFRELRERAFVGMMDASPLRAIRANDGIVRYAFASNLTATLNQAVAPLLALLIGGLLGASAAGLYKTAQLVVEVVSAPAELAMRSLFPETARLLPQQPTKFWRLIRQATALACLFGLVFGGVVMLTGPTLLTTMMGVEYGGLGTVLSILAFGFMPLVGAYPLETALLTIGGAGRLLAVRASSVAIVLGMTAWLGKSLGLVGVALASTAGAVAAFVGLLWVLLASRKNAASES